MHLWQNPSRLTGACIPFCIGLLVGGLWPFNFVADNHAALTSDGSGLRFDAPVNSSKQDLGGIVFTPNSLICRPKGSCDMGAITIVIELTAENEASSCLKRIVDLRQPDDSEAFYLGQWKSSLIVRTFIQPSAGGKPYDEIGVGGVLAAGRKSTVTIISRPSETAIYINGQLAKNTPAVRLLKENETLDGHKVFFGNSPDLDCPWAGSVRAFAVYGKAWTSAQVMDARRFQADSRWPCGSGQGLAVACYRFEGLQDQFISDLSGSANDLWKPNHLVFEKPSLGLPSMQSFSLSDLTLNLLGFMPLGFMLYLRLLSSGRMTAKNRLIFSVAVGFAVSLTIELTQVWLPGRDSSALDLISNTAGTVIGAFFGIKFE